mgnify:CR=1 FL=1
MIKVIQNIPIIILAGGRGERFISKENLPKQLAKVSNHPIIIEIILYYYKNGFNHFILPLGHKNKFFFDFFKNKLNIENYNLNILKDKNSRIIDSKINIYLFNAGVKSNKLARIYKSIKFLKKNVDKLGVCYGDIFANISFKKELLKFKIKGVDCVAVGFGENSPFGHMKIKNHLVQKFEEKPKLKDPINIGFYFFKKKIFSNISHNSRADLENTFLPKLGKKNKLACYIHNGYHFTVNSQKDLIEAKQLYKKNKNFFKNL